SDMCRASLLHYPSSFGAGNPSDDCVRFPTMGWTGSLLRRDDLTPDPRRALEKEHVRYRWTAGEETRAASVARTARPAHVHLHGRARPRLGRPGRLRAACRAAAASL